MISHPSASVADKVFISNQLINALGQCHFVLNFAFEKIFSPFEADVHVCSSHSYRTRPVDEIVVAVEGLFQNGEILKDDE
ncbi:MAG: hypothetical protein LBR80_13595 [Deltaproteobacteria bacterium]|jgi:hypothetical protein|nr:hypothetical protein [Deltaproteobacteria bacterium]